MPSDEWLDTEFVPSGNKLSMLFGPKILSTKLYQLNSIEDLELAKTLVRPSSTFVEDLSQTQKFSKEGYGSVPRAFIACEEDKTIPLEFQKWMIKNSGIDEVVEIKDADHMVMLAKPQQVFDALSKIENKFPLAA